MAEKQSVSPALEINTLVVNLLAGPSAGKTTCAWEIAEKLKKAGYSCEYVSEYAKELVYDGRRDLLDGTLEHQRALLDVQAHRVERLIGKVDFVVTDSPIPLNLMYLKENSPAYVKEVFDRFQQNDNFNIFVNRGDIYETTGRVHTLEQSREIDQRIKDLMNRQGVSFGTYNHSTINVSISNMILAYNQLNDTRRSAESSKSQFEETADFVELEELQHEKDAPVLAAQNVAEQSLQSTAPDQLITAPTTPAQSGPVHPAALTPDEFEYLTDEIKDITAYYQTRSEDIAEFMAFKAQFYQYSPRNAWLIHQQNPHSSFVSGYKGWEAIGYSVNKGEKAMRILRPIESTHFKRVAGEGSTQWTELKEATNDEKVRISKGEIETQTNIRYVPTPVFDISQTNCPKDQYPKIYSMGYDSIEHAELYNNIRQYARENGFTVSEKELSSITLRGYYQSDTNEIVINSALGDSGKLSTMCHELAHGVLHQTSTQPVEIKEFEAECFGTMLQRKYGFPADEQSQRYIKKYFDKLHGSPSFSSFKADETLNRLSSAFCTVTDGVDQTLAGNGYTPGYKPKQNRSQAQSKAPAKTPVVGVASAVTAVAENFMSGLERA